ncbi:MAG: hypothetical protein P8M49_03600 [Thalassotalea sp.]|nr:hypothetical protein [Thalassotalea sp.]MDG2392570.1 hypothetical protein [Thalassotalea sp.]
MLSNTVFLFLKDALPVFLLCSLLLSMTRYSQIKYPLSTIRLFVTITFGVIVAAILSAFTQQISALIDGRGYELLSILLLFMSYLLFLILTKYLNQDLKFNLNIMQYLIALILVSNGIDFLVYLQGYWLITGATQAIAIGIVIGLGICSSLAIILFFLVDLLAVNKQRTMAWTIMLFFSAGQLLQVSQLLNQIDLLANSPAVFSINTVIADDSALGYFLNSFIGYTSSPTFIELSIFIGALILPFIINRHNTKRPSNLVQANSVKESL